MTRTVEFGQRNPALRRAIIIEAAAAAIAADGLDELSIIALARETGMAIRTITHLFPSKQDILLEICEQHVDALVAKAEAADLPAVRTRRRLDALALALSKAIGEHQSTHRSWSIGMSRLPAKALKDLERKRNWLATLFADALAACLPAVVNDPDLANAALGSLLTLLLADRPEPLGREDYARFCVTCTLEGLRSTQTSKKVKASF